MVCESLPAPDVWSRRDVISLLGGTLIAPLSGCCSVKGFPKPLIPTPEGGAFPVQNPMTFLAPRRINTKDSPSPNCIDVHAHFFNASDVPVKGFLEGPVAYSMPSAALRELVKLLAPLGEALADIAPSAKDEYDSLNRLSQQPTDDTSRRAVVVVERQKEREALSVEFNKLVQSQKGAKFRAVYEEIMKPGSRATEERRPRIRTLSDSSLRDAMVESEKQLEDAQLREFAETDQSPYAEGILAFVGYMLSSRKSNLLTYQGAFTEEDHTIGVQHTLGLLVDFDRWLECAPRSSHEDQMKLHLKLSQLSNGYLRPGISYNPWTDIAEGGRSLALVEEAARQGFVAAKIYPPNGFRPWGNAGLTEPRGVPSGQDLDRVLKAFWLKCDELKLPVVAHANESMGSDAAHDSLGDPAAWQALVEAKFWPGADGPRVSLGHFGGDTDTNKWTQEFVSRVMGQQRSQRIFADLAYWENLQCATVGPVKCQMAKARLKSVLTLPVGSGQVVADRIMYGSDWLMLSQEKNWATYARQLSIALKDIAPRYLPQIFSENAQSCFPRLRLPWKPQNPL